jgi:2'-5' RNA ligase
MALLAVSYPDLQPTDFKWIQMLRARYDTHHFRIVKPHFTLVFPVVKTDRSQFADHVRSIAKQTKGMQFVIRRALTFQNLQRDSCHVFLVPDEGYGDIVSLHNRLYTGPLAEELNPDYPFTPHITIADSKDAAICKDLADSLNAKNISIEGAIQSIDIIDFNNDRVETIEVVRLQ